MMFDIRANKHYRSCSNCPILALYSHNAAPADHVIYLILRVRRLPINRARCQDVQPDTDDRLTDKFKIVVISLTASVNKSGEFKRLHGKNLLLIFSLRVPKAPLQERKRYLFPAT